MFYILDEYSRVISKQEDEPKEGIYGYYDKDIDLELYNCTFGSISKDGVLGYPQIKLKSSAELAKLLKQLNISETKQRLDDIEDVLSELLFGGVE